MHIYILFNSLLNQVEKTGRVNKYYSFFSSNSEPAAEKNINSIRATSNDDDAIPRYANIFNRNNNCKKKLFPELTRLLALKM